MHNEKNDLAADKINFNKHVELLVSKEESTGTIKDFIVSCLKNLILVKNCSNLQKVFRIAADVCCFVHNIKKRLLKQEPYSMSLIFKEIESKLKWIKVIQKPLYEDNRCEKQLKHYLGTYFDANHIVLCEGRLNKSDLDISSKNPILLLKNGNVNLLIILEAHLRTKHGGVKDTLLQIPWQYWLIQVVKYLIIRSVYVND